VGEAEQAPEAAAVGLLGAHLHRHILVAGQRGLKLLADSWVGARALGREQMRGRSV
jgi:hypothetical protein